MTATTKRHLAAAIEKLGHLMMSRVPVLEALDATADECLDKTVAKVLRHMRERVARRETFMYKTGNPLPRSVQLLWTAGEETGQLPQCLLRIAQVLRAELAK